MGRQMAGRGETKTTNVSRLVWPESILMLNRAKVELPQSLCAAGELRKIEAHMCHAQPGPH